MSVNYSTVVGWDVDLKDLEYTDTDTIGEAFAGLVQTGIKVTAGIPVATSMKFIPGAIIQNAVDGNIWQNTGTTAAPVWTLIAAGGGGGLTGIAGTAGGTAVGPTVSFVAGTNMTSIVRAGNNLTFNAATQAGGITQLTGDVLAGPGSGSQIATVVGLEGIAFDATVATPNVGDIITFDGTNYVAAQPGAFPPASAFSLGVAAPFDGLAGGTFTVSNPGLQVPTGNITASANVNPANTTFGTGSFIVGPTAPQTAAVLALYNQLHALAATNPVDLSTGNISQSNIGYGLGVFVPGVYKSTAAVSVVAATTITLNGVGDYVFDIAAALTTGANVNIVLTNGAQASRVYFVIGTITAGSSFTVGATNSLIGNFMLGNGGVATTIGSTATIQGRLLSTGAEVIVIDGTASSLFLPLS